jgi:hypothetical protein
MVLAATSETRARVGFDESPESTIMTEAKPRRLAWASRGAVVLLLAAACSSSSNADDEESNPDACVSGAAKVVGALMHCDGGACVPVDAEHFATTNTGNSLHCDWIADQQKLACKCDFDPGCDGPPLQLSRTNPPDEATMLDLSRTHCMGSCQACRGVCPNTDAAVHVCEAGAPVDAAAD